ncbi:MAG: Npun_F0494 family protein [Hormoscilla sp.]
MTPVSTQYSNRTIKRAERALSCSPFNLSLFATMRIESVPLSKIATQEAVQQQWTKGALSELAAENALLWLIKLGILRREVDGQGITDSFRLTPLGRQLLSKWQQQPTSGFPIPSLCDRISNACNRWLRLPI